MPISVQCQCGKRLTVKDQFAGKAVKCSGCGKPLRVPGGGPAAAPAAQSPGAASVGNPMNELFDEEGFGSDISAVCPSCGKEMAAEAVLCTQCGYNKATGQRMQGHLTPGVDISPGTLALQKAADDMQKADKMQRDMSEGAGMPWWMLGLILFVLGSATAIAVMAVMAASRTKGESTFNAMRVFLQLSGTACGLVSFGAFLKLVVTAFKENRTKGLLSLMVVYLFVFTFEKPKGRVGPLLVMLIFGGIAGGLLAYSQQV